MRQLLFHITIFIFILGIFQVIDAIKNVTFYDLPVAALFLLSTPQTIPRAPWQFVPVVQCIVQYLAGGPVLNGSLTEFASGS